MIEYMLLLFVIIGIVFAAKGLFTGMSSFMKGYMGEYVKCLMAHGELPGQGIADSDLKKNTTKSYNCSKQYTFSVSTGFTSTGSSAGGTSGSSGSASDSGNSNSSKNSKGSSQGNSADDSSTKSASEGTTSGSSEVSIANRERNRSSERSADESSSSSPGIIAKAERPRSGELATIDGASNRSLGSDTKVVGELAGGTGDSVNMGGGTRGRSKYRGISGQLAEVIEKNSKTAQSSSKNKPGESVVIAESESTPGPRRSTMKLYAKEQSQMAEENAESFSVGKLMKWIIIIALIIIIVIFFGGQLLNYSKSDS